jgi:DnaJ family protein C protein 28
MTEKSLDEEIKVGAQKARKLARYMSSTQDLVESQIEKARQRGDFDNLKGAGQPLHLEENPFEPVELRMAFKILKDNDFAPYWIELGKEIDNDLSKFWKEVEHFKKYTRVFYRDKHKQAAIDRYDKKKANFYFEQRLVLEKVNKKILDYNLHCPTFRLGRSSLVVDDEMYQAITQIEQLIEELKGFSKY